MRKKLGILFMGIGAALLIAALSLLVYNQLEASGAARASERVLEELTREIAAQEPDGTTELDGMAAVEIDGYAYIGYLTVPSLELELPVMSEWDYDRLQIAPCRYYGSVRTGDLVLCGHNYDQHFGRLSQLNTGDLVQFTDMEGTVTAYQVAELETLPPTAVEEMVSSGWPLSLYTCTYGGQSRVTVRCEYAENG